MILTFRECAKLRRFAGVNEVGARSRNPERSRGIRLRRFAGVNEVGARSRNPERSRGIDTIIPRPACFAINSTGHDLTIQSRIPMATSTPVPALQKRHSLVVAVCLLVALLLAIFALGFGLRSAVRSALPQLDGTLTVPGLSAPAKVIRDQHGFPTIQAASLDDLFFAQGYVTAQDRLFQMDGTRRFAAGELSEVVGNGQLDHDRQQRILGLRVAARKTIENSSAEERSHFEAYARGVNAFIESHRNQLPIEFRILRYSPKAWTSEDSALIGAYMIEELSTSPRHTLTREKIFAKLGPELTNDLYVNSSWRDRLPTVSRPNLDQETPPKARQKATTSHDALAGSVPIAHDLTVNDICAEFPQERVFDDRPMALGSNSWVVSGAHTVTGKPLLSNDMHLGQQMPNL
ncbi:MAG: penicillin acylase family protein, partial [Acidobacteriaceae bacterium]|nr:penicillin acylase family protein [Acidobacteriaceae bacterium]